jgi:hypothetical protein
MKFLRLDLLTLLISLFILGSCKNQDNIGLGINTANQLNGSLIDTSTIIVNTIPEDSVITSSGISKIPLGYFKDPVFGITESNIATDLNLPNSSAFTLPTGTVTIDSAVLILKYAHGFYGDSIASRYKVNVYQLNERVGNSNYYNTKQWSYNNSNLLGTKSFFARMNDSIKVNVNFSGSRTNLVKVAPQIRVPINASFINSILFNASSSQLSSNLIFKNNVKGLYVTLDKAGTTGAGGTFMLSQDSLAQINVFYRVTNGSTIDTLNTTLLTTNHAVEIKHTYSAAVQTELNNKTKSRPVFYLQGLAGLRTKISFPYLKNILKTIGSDITLNHAELIITPNPGSEIPFAPIPQISMYQYDLAHQRIALQDASTSDPRTLGYGYFGGFYSPTTKNYHINITAYIEDLLRGRTTDYGTFLGPVDIDNRSLAFAVTPTTAARTFAVGSDPTSPYRIKLNIIYTKLAK